MLTRYREGELLP